MMMLIKSLLAATAMLLVTQVGASAQLLNFSYVGMNQQGNPGSFSFQDSSSPNAQTGDIYDTEFALNETSTVNGSSGVPSVINFRSDHYGGGFFFNGGNYATNFDTQGAQLFTGTLDSPMFAPEFVLLNAVGSAISPVGGVFTITPVVTAVSAVPEPGTWMMMLLGGAMLGGFGILRRRRTASSLTLATA